jgi:hypothetical protein
MIGSFPDGCVSLLPEQRCAAGIYLLLYLAKLLITEQ